MCFFSEELQIDAQNSNFEKSESALHMKTLSMPLNFNLYGKTRTRKYCKELHYSYNSEPSNVKRHE